MAQYVIREHDRGRRCTTSSRTSTWSTASPRRSSETACSTARRSSTRSAATRSQPPKHPPPLPPDPDTKEKRPSGKGRFGESGGGWDTPSSTGRPRFPVPRSRDSHAAGLEAVALLLERVGVVVVAVALPEAGLVLRRAARSRAATWRSSRSTSRARSGAAASRARCSAARRRRGSRASRPRARGTRSGRWT